MKAMIFICMLIQFFGISEAYGSILQPVSVAVLVFAALLAVLLPRKELSINKWSVPTLVFVILMPFQSLLVFLIYGGDSTYILAYVLVSISLFSLSSYVSMYEFVGLFLLAVFIMILVIFIFDHESVVKAFNAKDEIGIKRLSSFGNHPNLLGHIFGLAFLLGGDRLISNRNNLSKIKLTFYLAITALSGFLLLLTSSRGALVSVIAASAVYSTVLMKRGGGRWVFYLSVGVISAIFLVVSKWVFFSQLLDINSEYRGVDSGLTGRQDNWLGVLEIVFSDEAIALFGRGYRSWSDSYFGFSTDSSYVNFLYEFGVITSATVIFLLFQLLWRQWRFALSGVPPVILIVLAFGLTEGFIARYLIAIGNPASLVILFAIFSCGKRSYRLKLIE